MYLTSNQIPNKQHLPKGAHKLIDNLADISAKRQAAITAQAPFNGNTAAGKTAERTAKTKDRKALAAAELAGEPLIPNQHHREWQEQGAKTRARVDALTIALEDASRELITYVREHRDEITAHQDKLIADTYAEWERLNHAIDQAHQANTDALNSRQWTERTKDRTRRLKHTTIRWEPSAEFEKSVSEPNISETEAAIRAAEQFARMRGVA